MKKRSKQRFFPINPSFKSRVYKLQKNRQNLNLQYNLLSMKELPLQYAIRVDKKISHQVVFRETGELVFETIEVLRLPDGSFGPVNYKYMIIVETWELHKTYQALNVPEGDQTALLLALKSRCSGWGVMRNVEYFLALNCIYFIVDIYNPPIDKTKLYGYRFLTYFTYEFE